MALTKCDVQGNIIGSLGTTPQERGLTTQEFKDKFDEMPEGIKEYINNVLTAELDAHIADYIAHKADLTNKHPGRHRFSITDYGAIGDGNSHTVASVYGSVALAIASGYFTTVNGLLDTDEVDYAALQECLNVVSEVYIPDNNYRINKEVKLKNGNKIIGESLNAILWFYGTGNMFLIDGMSNISFESIHFKKTDSIAQTCIKIGQISGSTFSSNFSMRNCKIIGFSIGVDLGNVYFSTFDNVDIEYCTKGINTFQATANSIILNQVSFYECTSGSVIIAYGGTGWCFNSCTIEGNTKVTVADAYGVAFNACYFEYIKDGGENITCLLEIGNQIVYPKTVTITGCTIIGDQSAGIKVFGVDGFIVNGLTTSAYTCGILFLCEANDDYKNNIKLQGLRHYNKTTSAYDSTTEIIIVANGNTAQNVTTIADCNYLMQLTKQSKTADGTTAGILNDADLETGDIITWNAGNYRKFKRKMTDGTIVTGSVQETLAGTTAQRPWNDGLGIYPPNGYMYFDITIGKPIWFMTNHWVDAAGATV